MIKLFKHISTYHRTTETLTIKECGQGLYVGVNSCEIIPSERVGELNYDEQTTSIVVPLSEVSVLIQSLSKIASGFIKPSKQLPTHLQDCIVCRLVDGQCRVYQSQYYAGQIIQGFGNLEDGESFYDDVLYWMPINMTDIYSEIEKELKSETCDSDKKSK